MSKQNISVSTDCVVINESGGKEKVLLIKRRNDPYKESWAIPGGFLNDDEPLEAGASRELKEETGLRLDHLHQLKAFGKPDRDPRGRTISIAFYGLATSEEKVTGADDAAEARWFDVNQLPDLGFDHSEIVAYALRIYRAEKKRFNR